MTEPIRTKKPKITIEKLAQMIAKGFEGFDERFEKMDERFEKIEGKIDALPDKDFVINHMGKLKGDFIIIVGKEDEKMNKLVEILKKKKILSLNEVKALYEIKVFPNAREIRTL